MSGNADWPAWGRDVLRPTRERLRLTRDELAGLSGVVESTIKNVESGKHKPTSATVLRLCAALSLPIPWAGPVLMLSLEGLDRAGARAVLMEALEGFMRRRADPGEYVARVFPRADDAESARRRAEVQVQVDVALLLCQRITDEEKE